MATPIERYVSQLHEGEQKRDHARERLLAGDDLGDGERTRLNGEIQRWNAELERTARALNDELRTCAERGRAPRTPAQIEKLRDPDLRAFGAQVKATIERLQKLETEKDVRAGRERLELEKERAEARKIQAESKRRHRDLDEEKKKIDRARKQLEIDRKRLREERARFD